MLKLQISEKPPGKKQLSDLEKCASGVLLRLRAEDCELRKPLFFEFAGSPKSGKSTIIGIVGHFLKRVGFQVVLPVEGASLRTPAALRDDWLAFNAWSGVYALQHILEDCHEENPPEIVILDRGLFDAAAWMEFLCKSSARITEDDRQRITDFFTLDLWRTRELGVFLFTADAKTSLDREQNSKLIAVARSVMNADVLSDLSKAYERVAAELETSFDVHHIDTSFRNGKSPSFQTIAYLVADRMVETMRELTSQRLLVTDRIELEGLEKDAARVEAITAQVLNEGSPQFAERQVAEESNTLQQIVPYALLRNAEGKYFWARRRSDHPRKILQGKFTVLVGGHAERIDWNSGNPGAVFETCLRRELEEELIGIQIQNMERLGVISDNRTPVGTRHLAILYRVDVGGSAKIRRQATDQEFGRESVSWKSESEIHDSVGELDPWSQIVAAGLFGAELPPPLPDEPTLFMQNNSGGKPE